MPSILIVEDDSTLNNGIAISLKQTDLAFSQAFSAKEARECLRKNQVDLIILDINLPDGSGLDLCKEIRDKSSTPIIFLTAKDQETDIVAGLSIGGDDYITKPFSLMILRARVFSILRRTESAKQFGATSQRVIIDGFVFDFDAMEFYRDGQALELSKTEQKLLKILVGNKRMILTRSVLIDKIWTEGAEYVDENALSVAVNRLRGKIELNPAKPAYIQTVYGIGYRWAVPNDVTA